MDSGREERYQERSRKKCGETSEAKQQTSGGEPIWKEGRGVTETKKERRHGCNRRNKEWRKSEEECEVRTSERKSGSVWRRNEETA